MGGGVRCRRPEGMRLVGDGGGPGGPEVLAGGQLPPGSAAVDHGALDAVTHLQNPFFRRETLAACLYVLCHNILLLGLIVESALGEALSKLTVLAWRAGLL